MLILTESMLYFFNLTAKFRSKKFSLSGQVNNWRDQVEPHSKGKSSKGASGRSGTSTAPCSTAYSRLTSTSVTSATTFSQATEPPSTPPKSSKYIPQATCSDAEDDAKEYADNDDGEDESDSEERAAVITEKEKGKAAMKVSVIILGEKCTYHVFRLLSKLTAAQILNCSQLRSREVGKTELPPVQR
jgi:cytoskeletal protein RodZ